MKGVRDEETQTLTELLSYFYVWCMWRVVYTSSDYIEKKREVTRKR